MFGKDAVIDVGTLIAGAAHIRDQDYIKGLNHFSNLTGDVENYGILTADDAVHLIGRNVLNSGKINAPVANLIGRYVLNTGRIHAPDGMIGMMVGDEVYVGQEGSQIFVTLDAQGKPGKAQVENSGTLDARKGSVFLGAGDMYSLAIRNSGMLKGKNITLDAGDNGIVSVKGGTLDASNSNPGEMGGQIKVLGKKIGLFEGTVVDASGAAGGGTVNIGGGFQGNDPALRNAKTNYVARGATIRADALAEGDGGEVIVWADGLTQFDGNISARGGALGGNGGFAEVSGKSALQWLDNASADLSAVAGAVGELLLDPKTITIVESPEDADINGNGDGDDITSVEDLDEITDYEGVESIISNDAVDRLLLETDLTLAAEEMITVEAAIGASFEGSAGTILTFVTEELNLDAAISNIASTVFKPVDNENTAATPSLNARVNSTVQIEGDASVDDNVTIATFSGARLTNSSINLYGGDDTLIFAAGSNFSGSVNTGAGNDIVTINEGATIFEEFRTGPSFLGDSGESDNDRVTIIGGDGSGANDGAVYTVLNRLYTGYGDDYVSITGNVVGLESPIELDTESGKDIIQFSETTYFYGYIDTGSDNDMVQFSGKTNILGGLDTGLGNDVIEFSGDTTIENDFFYLIDGERLIDGESEGIIYSSDGDDSFVFYGDATLDGHINGDGGEVSGTDTLDFTSSSLATAVDPGGEGPVILYEEETSGVTIPDSVISGGYENINKVLLPETTVTLIPPAVEKDHDEDVTAIFTRERFMEFNPFEDYIEDALIDELAELGIYARNNTVEENLQRFRGSAKFLQNIQSEQPLLSDFKVAAGRTEKERILAVLEAYNNLISSEGIDAIQESLEQVFELYYESSDNVSGEGFRAYLEERQDNELCAQVLKYLNDYRNLFEKIEMYGLTPREIEISKSVLLRRARTMYFSPKDLYEAIWADPKVEL
jgi:hypothetical protein